MLERGGDGVDGGLRPAVLAALIGAFSLPAYGGGDLVEKEASELPTVTVKASPIDDAQSKGLPVPMSPEASVASADTAALLDGAPGVALATGGGASSLPVVRGLEDERVKVLVDGMSITSACSNHMNPALSYIDPGRVASIQLLAGVTPVSLGGDNTGGTISVRSKAPVFAAAGEGEYHEGSLSSFYRSNNRAFGGAAYAALANENLSLSYTESWDKAQDYRDGNGDKVAVTLYKTRNRVATVAARGDGNLVTLQVGEQRIPYQGFVNANMDMTRNDASFFNLGYEGRFAWGSLKGRLYRQETKHEMDNLPERNAGHMLMLTKGKDSGFQLQADIALSQRDILRVGGDVHRQQLNDWWPGNTPWYTLDQDAVIINGGRRDRLGLFGEWEAQWNPQWKSLIGVRSDTVSMKTGPVQGYWIVWDQAQADAFNKLSRRERDHNFDLSAQIGYQPDAGSTYEIGLARKTRSPSLYERYFWYGPTNMAGWFGDNNNYNGNPDLRPEVAHTLSLSGDWHDAGAKVWQLRLMPYYTRIHDYIGVDFQGRNIAGLAQLQFANRQAEIYGLDASGRTLLWDNTAFGRGEVKAGMGWLQGRYVDGTGGKLYHIMPLNARLGLEQRKGRWNNAVDWQLVARKNSVDQARSEPQTPGYSLVNLRSAYEWSHVRLDLSVTNLFDKQYYLPLGGVNVPQFWAGARFPFFPPFSPVAGQGRSYNIGVTYTF